MAITTEEVEHVANLARLELSQEEAGTLTGQLGTILSYVEKLRQIGTDGVEPTSHIIPPGNVFREDVIRESLGQERALASAFDSADGCFRVPKVVE